MKLELELDDATGQPKELPEPLKKYVDSLVDTGFKSRHAELRTKLEKEVSDKLKASSGDPVVTEKLKSLQEENERFRIAELEQQKRYSEAEELRKQREDNKLKEHLKELESREKEIQRRDARLREMTRSEIKIAAKNLGARGESLDELAALLGADLDLDTDLKPFVKGADGQPAIDKDGKPVTIEGHVKAYLDTHQHHRATTAGAGGGSRGGATYTGVMSSDVMDAQRTVEAIQERIRKGDKSDAAVNELYEAQKALTKARAGGK